MQEKSNEKIFGIGLMRTGSFSLAEGLRILGYRTAHFHELREVMGDCAGWLNGNFDMDYMHSLDAALDNPIPAVYPQLDEKYPSSKFILTTRDVESWIISCRNYLAKVKPHFAHRSLARMATYGIDDFDEERWREVYERHHSGVTAYFRSRMHDLLIMNIPSGDGWEKLCPFLEKPLPKEAFPKLNTIENLEFE